MQSLGGQLCILERWLTYCMGMFGRLLTLETPIFKLVFLPLQDHVHNPN